MRRLHPAIRAVGAYAPARINSRSTRWPRIRREHLKRESECLACGGTRRLQVHHIRPFHLHPELELAPWNLATLCEYPSHDCHFTWGHFHNWSLFNPIVRADAAWYLGKSNQARK